MATPTRWPPWIEAVAEATANLTVASTTVTAIPGCTVTFTPAIDCRLAVTYKVTCTLAAGTGADDLRFLLTINGAHLQAGDGSDQTENLNLRTVGDRFSAGTTESIDLVGGTAYTIALNALLGASTGSSYTVLTRRTHLGPVVAMPNLHS